MTATAGSGIEWGYARVSTKKQDLHRQIHALTSYGIPADPTSGDGQRLSVDKLTGKHLNRQGWLELRPRMRADDVLNLPELDRLGPTQTGCSRAVARADIRALTAADTSPALRWGP